MEVEAFVSDMLIATWLLAGFLQRRRVLVGVNSGVCPVRRDSPFIVAGRLQQEKRIGHNQPATLKMRYEWLAL